MFTIPKIDPGIVWYQEANTPATIYWEPGLDELTMMFKPVQVLLL